MLSLIPALLLFAFQGPTALERLGHEGRLPSALKALERALTSERVERGTETGSNLSAEEAKRVFAQLAALTSDPSFSAAIAQFLQGTVQSADCENVPEIRAIATPDTAPPDGPLVPVGLEEGFLQGRRTRDGPR